MATRATRTARRCARGQTFAVTGEAEVAGTPEQVWDAVTRHSDGWLWPITYEPRQGGAETGLTADGGRVTAWEPGRRFTTTAPDAVGTNQLDYTVAPPAGGTAVSYVHPGVGPDDDDLALQYDACVCHTDLYRHSMAEYVAHFAGRDATYVEVLRRASADASYLFDVNHSVDAVEIPATGL